MTLESRHEPLLPAKEFLSRQGRYLVAAAGVVAASLGIGVLGYHSLAGLCWVDALLNASCMLTSMGPVASLPNMPAKLFASAYALFSALAFFTTVGITMTPIVHRLLHRFHIEEEREER